MSRLTVLTGRSESVYDILWWDHSNTLSKMDDFGTGTIKCPSKSDVRLIESQQDEVTKVMDQLRVSVLPRC